jgi:L-asparaginase II
VQAAPLVRVVRSGLEESLHVGHVAVCDARGRLLASAGDPDLPVYLRSCAKPVQAAVSLSLIGDERLPDEAVAIMCSSHNGEPVHVRAVRGLLRRAGLPLDALQTPLDRPLDPASARAVRTPQPLFHNCSGKHAGMLAACARAGLPTATYRARSHPLQRRVLSVVRRLTGVEEVHVGVDGCGVPVHGVPLRAIATMYARLGAPPAAGDLAPSLGRAIDAMRAAPYIVGGRDRDDTAVMRAAPGIVMKEGAEALNCAAALEPAIGVAVKIGDGGYRAAGPATIAVLDAMGLLPTTARRALQAYATPRVTGGGRPVGRLEPIVALRT